MKKFKLYIDKQEKRLIGVRCFLKNEDHFSRDMRSDSPMGMLIDKFSVVFSKSTNLGLKKNPFIHLLEDLESFEERFEVKEIEEISEGYKDNYFTYFYLPIKHLPE